MIASSPTDLQPVLEAVVESAVRLCEADAWCSSFDGRSDPPRSPRHGVRLRGDLECSSQPRIPITVIGGSVDGSGAPRSSRSIHILDVVAESGTTGRADSRCPGYRTVLAVPMLREGTPIGVIVRSRRPKSGLLATSRSSSYQTFADQAVIAIENVRLFSELQARTAELTRSVEQLTALGEVGRAVSSTLDLDTVLDTIVTRANQLAGTDGWRRSTSTTRRPRSSELAREPLADRGRGRRTRSRARRRSARERARRAGRPCGASPVQIPDIRCEDAYESPVRGAAPARRATARSWACRCCARSRSSAC